MSAIKKAMGIKSRYFLVSDVQKFLRDNADFKTRKEKSGDTFKSLLEEAVQILRTPGTTKVPLKLVQRIESKLA